MFGETAAGDVVGSIVLEQCTLKSNHALFGGRLFACTSLETPLSLISSDEMDCEKVSTFNQNHLNNITPEGTRPALLVTHESPETGLEGDSRVRPPIRSLWWSYQCCFLLRDKLAPIISSGSLRECHRQKQKCIAFEDTGTLPKMVPQPMRNE
ncbi:hypothetical protein BLNAU_17029 [Blattamonas nauphoetae]|nr:hypothetical protein BLNAU_17961 [Blattamonas nauphoetae]KAK2948082.1 hypothetical protein BLNAU_17029 [Blattamonas nauphoetae]